ncbi:hypothetical protein OBBRIDRAFT_827616 [Obba rivulosa]|uniref:Extracellular mutant protein 11 C-terminal domain-containing protein n=1 Tax=Obba rivulosa TaxID=1052685 RepID=A0A8E2AMU4_9APHY|nr:hypothetical protein OBBRIDRAFT_827616 [Obba rivulosa]
MSARTPFIPQKSSASRSQTPAQTDQNSSVSQPLQDSFRPNGLLPVSPEPETDGRNQSNTRSHLQDPSQPDSLNSLQNGINKPLNLSGFAKKNKSQHQLVSVSGKSRKSAENASPDSRTQKPFSPHQQALRTMAPRPSSPFFPNSNGSVSMSAFRTPTAPASSRLHSSISAQEFDNHGTHIPTSNANNASQTSALAQAAASVNRYQSLPSHRTAHAEARTRSISHPSLENIQEATEEDDGDRSFTNHANMQDMADIQRQTSEGLYDDFGDGNSDHGQQTLRRTNKRFHGTEEEEEELNYGNVPKRYKVDEASNDLQRPQSRMSTPAAHFPPPSHMDRGRFQPPAAESGAYDQLQTPAHISAGKQPSQDDHALHRLLGQDLEAYVDLNVENYEQSKKKWSECPVDEWKAGADVLAGKFTKLLDFVKEHMTTKLTLYASLHSTVATHRGILSERDKMLKEAREGLVREGGNVVGGGRVPAGEKEKEKEES